MSNRQGVLVPARLVNDANQRSRANGNRAVRRSTSKPIGVAIFLIFDKRMPRSLSFCYKEISSNLHDLEMAYGRQYNAGDIARALAQTIKDGEQNNIHMSNLHDFITSFISTNNQLSLTIAKDFNLN